MKLTEHSEIDRFKLLPDDKDFVFDFNKQDGLAAGVANAVTFPALVGTGQTFTVGEFERMASQLLPFENITDHSS